MEDAQKLDRNREDLANRFGLRRVDDYQEKWLYVVHGNKVRKWKNEFDRFSANKLSEKQDGLPSRMPFLLI